MVELFSSGLRFEVSLRHEFRRTKVASVRRSHVKFSAASPLLRPSSVRPSGLLAQKAVVSDIKFTDAPAKKTTGSSIFDVHNIVVLLPHCPLLYPAVYLDVLYRTPPVDDSGDDDGQETLLELSGN